jgi:hypothetical protein
MQMNEPEPPKGRFAAFWTTLPGVLTGVAGLIGAIAGVLALFIVPGDSDNDGSSRAAWADEVDPICNEAFESARQLPISQTADVNAQVDYFRQVGAIAHDLAEKVRAVEAPAEDQANIDRMTALIDEQGDGLDAVALAYLSGDPAGYQSARQKINDAETEQDALASSLGVTACAQGVQPNVVPP